MTYTKVVRDKPVKVVCYACQHKWTAKYRGYYQRNKCPKCGYVSMMYFTNDAPNIYFHGSSPMPGAKYLRSPLMYVAWTDKDGKDHRWEPTDDEWYPLNWKELKPEREGGKWS